VTLNVCSGKSVLCYTVRLESNKMHQLLGMIKEIMEKLVQK